MSKPRIRPIVVVLASLLFTSNIMLGFPADVLINKWNESNIVDNLYHATRDASVVDKSMRRLPAFTQKAHAANFSMQTGYYTGNGSTQSISGLGFQPQTVIIEAATTAGQGIFKTSAMPSNNTAYFSATVNDTSGIITLDSDGFSVSSNANANSANVRYTWVAFAGSDCTSTGTICVGTYSGNGTNPRKITTGFQPALAIVKRSTAVAGNFRTASMASNVGNYFTTTAQVTNGSLFTTLVSDGFNVGSTNNTSGGIYYYIAFKAVAGVMAEGTYTGDGLDNRNITGFGSGATPNFVFVKNSNSSTTANRNPVMNSTHLFGDYSSYVSVTTANAANMIQKLQDDGFQVGTAAQVNQSGNAIYWAAFGGSAGLPAGSGTFDMAVGSYAGNGTSQNVTGLGFSPDLVIVKSSTASQSVFRTSLMAANNTAYLAAATANFTGGITSLGSDGFSVGSSTVVNTSGTTYHWQAFGNAYDPVTKSGATDFAVGTYTGNGVDNRDITDLPWQPDMVAVKRSGATAGTWRSTANSGDSSSFFGATLDGANRVQALQTFGYQIGTQANVNSSGNTYNWFAFKTGDNFTVGSYSGTGSAQDIVTGFQPDLAWIKRSTAVNGVHRGSSLVGDAAQYFAATANATGRITGVSCNVFTVGTQTETNQSGGTYRYAAWRAPNSILSVDIVDSSGCSVASPGVSLPATDFSFSCTNNVGIFGTSSQKLRVTNTTTGPSWSVDIAATNGATELWRNGGNNQQFDYNDSSGSPPGCDDGADSDTKAGRLSLDPSTGTIVPKSGCNTTGLSLGSAASFTEGSIDAISLISASGAATNCYWDITGIGLGQYIPGGQPGDTYTLDLTLTITAF